MLRKDGIPSKKSLYNMLDHLWSDINGFEEGYFKEILECFNQWKSLNSDGFMPFSLQLSTFSSLTKNKLNNSIPNQLQMELAMLWRTLNIIRISLSSQEMMVSFFIDLLQILKGLPPLSLSSVWNSHFGEIVVGKPDSSDNIPIPILPVPELSYLHDQSSDDEHPSINFPNEHDPLGFVQKLFDTTESFAITLPTNERTSALNTCLALAVKSGRASLLFRVANMIFDLHENLSDLDMELLEDIKNHFQQYSNDKSLTSLEGIKHIYHHYDTTEQSQGGCLVSFGKADHGKLGHGDAQIHRLIPTLIESIKTLEITKVASMSTYSVAIDRYGSAFVWGTGGSAGAAQGLRTDIEPQLLEALPSGLAITDVSCGLGHALFLVRGGRVLAWGNGGNGRLGLGDSSDRSEACFVSGLETEVIRAVQCGASHSLAVSVSGKLYSWGKNSQGQCGKGNLEDVLKPFLNITLQSETISKIGAGWEHSLALTTTGIVYAWGCGYKDSRRGVVPAVLGLGHNEGRMVPERIAALDGILVSDVASGWDHCMALDSKGRVFTWGSGQNGKLGHGNEEHLLVPTVISSLSNTVIVHISAGCEHSAAINASGELLTWGHGDGGRLGHGDTSPCNAPNVVRALNTMKARPIHVHCGDKFTMVIIAPSTNDSTNTERRLLAPTRERLSSDPIRSNPAESIIDSQTRGLSDGVRIKSISEESIHSYVDSMLSSQDPNSSHDSLYGKGTNTTISSSLQQTEKVLNSDKSLLSKRTTRTLNRNEIGLLVFSFLVRISQKQSKINQNTNLTKNENITPEVFKPFTMELSWTTFSSLLGIIDNMIDHDESLDHSSYEINQVGDVDKQLQADERQEDSVDTLLLLPWLRTGMSGKRSLNYLEDNLEESNDSISFSEDEKLNDKYSEDLKYGARDNIFKIENENGGVSKEFLSWSVVYSTLNLLQFNMEYLIKALKASRDVDKRSVPTDPKSPDIKGGLLMNKSHGIEGRDNNQVEVILGESGIGLGSGSEDQLQSIMNLVNEAMAISSPNHVLGFESLNSGSQHYEGKQEDEEDDNDDEDEDEEDNYESADNIEFDLRKFSQGEDYSSDNRQYQSEDLEDSRSRQSFQRRNRSNTADEMSEVTYRDLDQDQHGYRETTDYADTNEDGEGTIFTGQSEGVSSTNGHSAGGVISAGDDQEERGDGDRDVADVEDGNEDAEEGSSVRSGGHSPALSQSHESVDSTGFSQGGLFSENTKSKQDDVSTLYSGQEYEDGDDNVELQRAILSSIEQQDEDNGEICGMDASNHITDEDIRKLFHQLHSRLDFISKTCFLYLRRGPPSSTSKSASYLIWWEIQKLIKTGFIVFFSAGKDSRDVLHSILRNTESVRHVLAGVCEGFLEAMLTSKSKFAIRFAEDPSEHELDDHEDVSVKMEDVLYSLDYIKYNLLADRVPFYTREKPLSPTLEMNQRTAHPMFLFIREIIGSITFELIQQNESPSSPKCRDIQKLFDAVAECIHIDVEAIVASTLSSDHLETKITNTQDDRTNFKQGFTTIVLPYITAIWTNQMSLSTVCGFISHAFEILSIFPGNISSAGHGRGLKMWLEHQCNSILLFLAKSVKFLSSKDEMTWEGIEGLNKTSLRRIANLRDSSPSRLFDVSKFDGFWEDQANFWGNGEISTTLSSSLTVPAFGKPSYEMFIHSRENPGMSSLFYFETRIPHPVLVALDARCQENFKTIHLFHDLEYWNSCGIKVEESELLIFADPLINQDLKTNHFDASDVKMLRLLVFASLLRSNGIDVLESSANADMELDLDILSVWITSWIICILVIKLRMHQSLNTEQPSIQKESMLSDVITKALEMLQYALGPLGTIVNENESETLLKREIDEEEKRSDSSLDITGPMINYLNTECLKRLHRQRSLCDDILFGSPTVTKGTISFLNKPSPMDLLRNELEYPSGLSQPKREKMRPIVDYITFLVGNSTTNEALQAALLNEVLSRRQHLATVIITKTFTSILGAPDSQAFFIQQLTEIIYPNNSATGYLRQQVEGVLYDKKAVNTPLHLLITKIIEDLDGDAMTFTSGGVDDHIKQYPRLLLFIQVMNQLEGTPMNEASVKAIFSAMLKLRKYIEMNVFESQALNSVKKNILEAVVITLKIISDVIRPDATGFHLLVKASEDTGLLSKVISESCSQMKSISRMLEKHVVWHINTIHQSFDARITYILPRIKRLESTSPTVIPNVATINGDFILGFWLKIPKISKSATEISPKCVHLLSRVQETGEMNLVDLVQGHSESPCHPCIYLNLYESKAEVVVVQKATESMNEGSPQLRKKSIIDYSVKATIENPFDRWLNVVVIYEQFDAEREDDQLQEKNSNESKPSDYFSSFVLNGLETPRTPRLPVSVDKGFDIEISKKSVQRPRSMMSLYIDGKQHNVLECSLFKHPLNQMVIIGPLPQLQRSMNSFDRADGLEIADIYWCCSRNETEYPSSGRNPQRIQLLRDGMGLEQPPTSSLSLFQKAADAINGYLSLCSNYLERLLSMEYGSDNSDPQIASALALCINLYETSPTTFCSGFGDVQETLFGVIHQTMKYLFKIKNLLVVFKNEELLRIVTSAKLAFGHFLDLLIRQLSVLINNNNTLKSNLGRRAPPNGTSSDENAEYLWNERITCMRSGIAREIFAAGWELVLVINENMILTRISQLVSTAFEYGLIDNDYISHASKKEHERTLLLTALVCGGGWPPFVSTQGYVDIFPRALFLTGDPKGLEHVLFPCTAKVFRVDGGSNPLSAPNTTLTSFRSGILLSSCTGAHFRTKSDFIIPAGDDSLLPSTEMIQARDLSPPLSIHHFGNAFLSLPLPNANKLVGYLRQSVVMRPTLDLDYEVLEPRPPSVTPIKSYSNFTPHLHNEAYTLMQSMSQFRCYMVQLANIRFNKVYPEDDHFLEKIVSDMNDLMSVAALDPVVAVTCAFSVGLFKGAQLDVLRNLLKEGDITFLEKISLRIWRQVKRSMMESKRNQEVVQMIPVAGDVQLIDSKIRALSHFPTVRLPGVSLTKMSGRWFYECTLLSDGLMQIGWADTLFRCDPVCGQGVGDHLHSWAFDGLRTKKWCVSCESYGKRWRVGDVVGVLVDMDLLEMRFSINGEDLGAAFSNFSATELFPALSLNVRQILRVNFGQSKFMYPPSDKIAFRPVCEAMKSQKRPDSSLSMSSLSAPQLTSESPSSGSGSAAESGKITEIVAESRTGGPTTELSSPTILNPVRQDAPEGSNSTGRIGMIPDGTVESLIQTIERRRANGDSSNWRNRSEESGAHRSARHSLLSGAVSGLVAASSGQITQMNTQQQQQQRDDVVEMRRQSLIENLIGMGFPIDWALRAAEHCEASVSESAAIAWIIERMELEQAKLEEFEGDSRQQDEDFETADDMALDQLHRAVESKDDIGADHSHALLLLGSEGRTRGASSAMNVAMGLGLGMGGSSTAYRTGSSGFGGSVNQPQNPLGTGQTAQGPNLGAHPVKQDEKSIGVGADRENREILEGALAWNSDLSFPPILVGRYTARRRHDADKQEVLLQVSDLDPADLSPIIASCQLALCVFYARATMMHILSLLGTEDDGQTVSNNRDGDRNPSVKFRHRLISALLNVSNSTALSDMLKMAFRQHMCCTNSSPDKLFPSTLHGSTATDVRDRLPPFVPFTSMNAKGFNDLLSIIEGKAFISSLGNISAEESTIQTTNSILCFLRLLLRLSSGRYDSILSKSTATSSPSNPSSLMSTGYYQLEELQLKEVGVFLTPETQKSDASNERPQLVIASSRALLAIIEDSLQCLEKACEGSHDRRDWISSGLEKDTDSDILAAASADLSTTLPAFNIPSKANVLWSYFILRSLLTTDATDQLKQSGKISSRHFSLLHRSENDPMSLLLSPEVLARLLKASVSQNTSLKFCIFDLGALILARVNDHLESTQLMYTATPSESGTANALALQVAAEYYLSVAKERKLMQAFATRLKSEDTHRRLHSPYTRSICSFLLQWQLLRRSLGLFAYSSVHDELIQDWATLRSMLQQDSESIAKPIDKNIIQVLQISSNSITIAWNLTNYNIDPKKNIIKTDYSIYVTAASNMGLENRVLTFADIPVTGFHRIEGLDPDTMYKISLSKGLLSLSSSEDANADSPHQTRLNMKQNPSKMSSPSKIFSKLSNESPAPDSSSLNSPFSSQMGSGDPVDDLFIYASTEGEAVFILDPAHCAPSLLLGNGNLTVRNTSNKKWSTCRATVRLTSGLHRWDIHIDRCVSKNIFIGVMMAEGRLDNYVGCDKFGWAFLANKAVWHNKSKLRSYGDLFRSGDTVTVTVDLDLGILSFALNGKDLGIAVEGISGPIYPAFSLYNEDDQIALLPPRGPIETLGWSASAAERVLDRVESLKTLLNIIPASYSKDTTSPVERDHFENAETSLLEARMAIEPLSRTEVVDELYYRWELFCRGIGIRTLECGGDIVPVVISTELTTEMSEERLKPGQTIRWESSKFVVVGVGKHRLWMQVEESGAILGFTRQMLSQMSQRTSIIRIHTNRPILPSIMTQTNFPQYSFTSLHDFDKAIKSFKWTLESDMLLVQWIELLSKSLGKHPLNIHISEIQSPRGFVASQATPNVITFSLFERFTLLADFPESELRLRSLLLIHLNDILAPLLPLLYHGSSCHPHNHPIETLSKLKSLIFTQVKYDFIFKLASPTKSAESKITTGPATLPTAAILPTYTFTASPSIQTNESVDSSSNKDIQRAAEEIQNSSNNIPITHTLQLNIHNYFKSAKTIRVESLQFGSEHYYSIDSRWRILAGLQCSFLGDFIRSMEETAATKGGRPGTSVIGWESCLRKECTRGSLWGYFCPPSFRITPVVLKAPGTDPLEGEKRDPEEDYPRIPTIQLLLLRSILNENGESKSVSDWSIFITFIYDAITQIQPLLMEVFSVIDKDSGGSGDMGPLYGSDDQTVGRIGLILNILHFTGVLLGLVLRSGASAPIELPEFVWTILVSTGSVDTEIALDDRVMSDSTQLKAADMALRHGISTVFPDIGLSLFTSAELRRLVCGSFHLSVENLKQSVEYTSDISPQDFHIQLFWASLQEITTFQLMKFICRINGIPDDELHRASLFNYQSRGLQFTIGPTILSESSAIVVLPQGLGGGKILIPRIKRMDVMISSILEVLGGLK